MRSIFALVKADTRGFSLRARGGRTVKPEMPDDAPVLAQQVEGLGGLLRQTDDPLREIRGDMQRYQACRLGDVTLRQHVGTHLGLPRLVLFRAGLDPGRTARRSLMRILRYPYAVIRDLWRGDINLRAMGLVYTTLLSLIPLRRLRFAILKIFGARHDLRAHRVRVLPPRGRAGGRTSSPTRVMQFADRVSSGVAGSVGFALLAWTLLGTIKKVEDSFNFLWRVEQPRSFARRIAEYLTLLVVGPLLLVGFIGLIACRPRQRAGAGGGQSCRCCSSSRARPSRCRPVRDGHARSSRACTCSFPTRACTGARRSSARSSAGVLWAAVGKMFTAFVVYSTRLTHRLCGLRVHRGGAAVDLLRLADPARRRAAVVLHPESDVPAARAAGAAPLVRRDRATRAED